MQPLNVAAGGSLYQDIFVHMKNPLGHLPEDMPVDVPYHSVHLAEESIPRKVFETEKLQVNSFHHQAVKKTASDFRVTAVSEDCVIEAIEDPSHDFVVGVQWHPEDLCQRYHHFLKLFEAFVVSAGRKSVGSFQLSSQPSCNRYRNSIFTCIASKLYVVTGAPGSFRYVERSGAPEYASDVAMYRALIGQKRTAGECYPHALLTTLCIGLILLIRVREPDHEGRNIMRTMTVRESSRGRKIRMNAKRTYRDTSGEWIAEVDEKEFRKACSYVCKGVENCIWEKLQVQTDLDDDGKEYKVVRK